MAKAFKILPKNYLEDWGEFESWASGVASAPDGWTVSSSPTIARESTNIKFGSFSARVIGSTGAGIGGLTRTIPDGADYSGRTFKLGVWGQSASTGPYIELNDGVASKTVHLDGSNAFVFYTTPAMKLDYNATQIRINLLGTMNSTSYFDGAVLCEGEDLFTNFDTNIDISGWRPSLSLKQDQYEISQSEGSFIPETHLQSKNIRVTGQVLGSDVVSARSNFDSLLKSIFPWKPNEKRNLYLYDDRVYEVMLKGFEHEYENGLQYIPFGLQFSNQIANSRSINRYRTRQVIAGTVTEFSVTYNGSAESKPKISFIANQGATITTCVLENLTTQENIVYSGTVPTGVALDIDCALGTIQNSSVNHIANFGTSDFIRLVRGVNYFRFQGSNCTINIDHFERYL